MPPRGLAVAAELGLDMAGHLSEQVTPSRLLGADLVLGMARLHGREVVSRLPALWPHVFTLEQFSARIGHATVPRHAAFDSWVAALGDGRVQSDLLGHLPADDVVDPVEGPVRVWRRVAQEIRQHVVAVLDACEPLLRVAPPVPAGARRTRPTAAPGVLR